MRQQSRQPDRGPVGQIKSATLTEYLLRKRELDNSFKPNQTKGKRQPARENTIVEKELLTLAPGHIADERS
jgi:hypothetical protein